MASGSLWKRDKVAEHASTGGTEAACTSSGINKECVSAARYRSENRRYTEHWILACLLLDIQSPSGYSFLRDNEILPLPCVTTVQKYLSVLRVKCGFDTRFFAAFKKIATM